MQKNIIFSFLFIFTSCVDESFYTKRGTKELINELKLPPVCDPLAQGKILKPSNGIKVQIVDGTGYNPRSLSAFENMPIIYEEVYLSQISVPTRKFDEGFMLSSGAFLENATGGKLLEWFKIQGEGQIILDPLVDSEGFYELALIADDGAKLQIDSDEDGIYEDLLNYGSVTSPRFICGTNFIRFQYNKPLKFKFEYFQGPKYHLSFNLLWRKVRDVNAADLPAISLLPGEQDLECGKSGANRYFDPALKSAPTALFNSLTNPSQSFVPLSNGGLRSVGGWKIIRPENFILVENESNPCN
jgi:hypothetical protein